MVETVRYAKRQGARGTLVVPYWPGSAFWAYLALMEEVVEVKRFRPFLKAPAFFKNRMFVGRPKFNFSVFSFDFGKM